MTWSAITAVGLTGLYAESAPWMVARQALSADSDGQAVARDTVSVSADGRFVAFASRARLLPEDTNNARDIYVLDLQTSVVTLESITTEGVESRSDSTRPSISADGRFVLFESLAMRLQDDPTDWQPVPGLYLRDRVEHRTTRLTTGRDGQPFPCTLTGGAISADGRYVVLSARDDPFAMGGGSDRVSVYRLARETGVATRISIATDGRPATTVDTYDPAVSADGNVVAFVATSSLDPERPWRSEIPRPFQMSQVYVRDVAAGTTTCVGCLVKDAGPHTRTLAPSVSADGRYIAFVADDISLSGKRSVLMAKIWLYDRASSLMTLVTQSPHGRAPNGTSRHPVVSAHGDFVVFESDASNLLCDRRCARDARDENLLPDIYRFDRVSGTIRRLSEDAGDEWWEPSVGPSMDGTGRIVAFSSRHPMGARDIEADFDLFVLRDETPPYTH